MIALNLLLFILIISEVSFAQNGGNRPPDILPQYCAQAVQPWENTEGVYKMAIRPSQPYEAYCIRDPQDGPMWTVIQRRIDGSENFFRNWTDYEWGFGNKNGEYFLGLKNIYELTNAEENELWVQVTDYEDETRSVTFGKFSISNADQNYTLSVSESSNDFGKSLLFHNGYQFHTQDRDRSACALKFEGAWWFTGCYFSHLNGPYRSRVDRNKHGVDWNSWKRQYSMKYAHMAIRPKRFS